MVGGMFYFLGYLGMGDEHDREQQSVRVDAPTEPPSIADRPRSP